jgi:hypothetical protein
MPALVDPYAMLIPSTNQKKRAGLGYMCDSLVVNAILLQLNTVQHYEIGKKHKNLLSAFHHLRK